MYKPGFFRVICGLPQAFYKDMRPATFFIVGAKDLIYFYLVNVNFSKIVAFKGTIRIFLNMVAVHIEGLKHPPICLFDTLFSFQCPFNWFNFKLTTPHHCPLQALQLCQSVN
jgi:hypothetical protein